MEDILFNIVFGVIVALLTWAIPKTLEWLQLRKKCRDLKGKWLSRYQSIDTPTYYYNENVNVTVSFLRGKIKIVNSNCKEGYFYNVYCQLIDKLFISGRWVSTKNGASACGCVSLIVGPHGNIMYGYWSGYREDGGRNFGKWVLGRKEEDLDSAMQFLEN